MPSQKCMQSLYVLVCFREDVGMYEFHLACFCQSPTPIEIRGSGDYCRILTYKRFFQLSFIFRQTFVLKVSQLCPWGLRRSDEFPSHKNVMVEIDRGIHRYATMAWWPCATPPSNILPALPYPLSEVSYRSGSRDTPKCAQEQQKLVSGSRPTEVSWFLEFQ